MEIDWNLRLRRMVIEDGNPEFHAGDLFEWVVQFQCDALLKLSTETERAAVLIDKNRYFVNAEVIYISKDSRYDCCVLDFGINAISESGSLLGMPLPHDCREGDYVAGDVKLEHPLCTDIQPYKIGHQWRVNRITAESKDLYSNPGGFGSNETHEMLDTGSLKAQAYILSCSHLGPPTQGGKPPIDEEALKYLKPFRSHSI